MGYNKDILVYLFLRGGCDALNFVPPLDGEDRKTYEEERPNLKVATSGPDGLLKLDGRFGLHPGAPEIFELYQAKKLAIVHAVGMGFNTRSHFDAQNLVESGFTEKKNTNSGWLTRHLECLGPAEKDCMPAVSCGGLPPTSLLGENDAVVVNEPARMGFGGKKEMAENLEAAVREMYAGLGGSWLAQAGTHAIDSLRLIQGRLPAGLNANGGTIAGANGAANPAMAGKNFGKDLSHRLKNLSELIKMDLGIRVATVDMGNWDTHRGQGDGAKGPFANHVQELSEALGTFFNDMTASGRKVTIIVMSEFGRRLRENANRGTDHGHGGFLMALGNNVNGGRVYGSWPGLKTDQLYDRADLAVATDYRTVVCEALVKRTGNSKIHQVFPGFKMPRPLGIFS